MRNHAFRNNGAIGALLDEYQKAIAEMQAVISEVSAEELTKVVDTTTEDPDCKSIQTILDHVIHSGYRYTVEASKSEGGEMELPEKASYTSINNYQTELSKMFLSAEALFKRYPSIDLGKKRELRWKHISNIDLLYEHAIVHILRHRRQIERFIAKLRSEKF